MNYGMLVDIETFTYIMAMMMPVLDFGAYG
jgi:hypothetical protein